MNDVLFFEFKALFAHFREYRYFSYVSPPFIRPSSETVSLPEARKKDESESWADEKEREREREWIEKEGA